MNRSTTTILSATILAAITLGGCTTAPTSDAGKAALSGHVDGALIAMKAADPTLDSTLGAAAGYAVLPKIGKGGAWLGAAYGKGEVFAKGVRDGYCDVLQITLGIQGGGQQYAQLVIFKSPEALDSFKRGKFRFAANASAVALTAAVGTNADYGRSVTNHVYDGAGFMYEAALGIQTYTYVEK
jgi:lipid-binding SYLF domain-containing protein